MDNLDKIRRIQVGMFCVTFTIFIATTFTSGVERWIQGSVVLSVIDLFIHAFASVAHVHWVHDLYSVYPKRGASYFDDISFVKRYGILLTIAIAYTAFCVVLSYAGVIPLKVSIGTLVMFAPAPYLFGIARSARLLAEDIEKKVAELSKEAKESDMIEDYTENEKESTKEPKE